MDAVGLFFNIFWRMLLATSAGYFLVAVFIGLRPKTDFRSLRELRDVPDTERQVLLQESNREAIYLSRIVIYHALFIIPIAFGLSLGLTLSKAGIWPDSNWVTATSGGIGAAIGALLQQLTLTHWIRCAVRKRIGAESTEHTVGTPGS